MRTLAIFAINYDQLEHSFYLCFTGWTVAPKCLFPLRPSFVKIMPSWALSSTVPWNFSQCLPAKQSKHESPLFSQSCCSRAFYSCSITAKYCIKTAHIQLKKKNENVVILVVYCRVMSLLDSTPHSGSNLHYAHSPMPPNATYCCQVIVLVPK